MTRELIELDNHTVPKMMAEHKELKFVELEQTDFTVKHYEDKATEYKLQEMVCQHLTRQV
ncbi:hypothetical protein [Virgibacillus chiguensis]|uniref:hypothetical protein n=1 Tax=Virgibacillus chiguensis TaxID=411959 RepID=UPI001BAE810C|nr:hypothetical protein [Virgibacillus chiguensis]